ncbi:antirestriction protein ArdA [Nostoc sp. ChiQUE01b]|uniref:antirestriction protein ArdA n=1 Tax=Nostoc sp. ChiQUE01b TaxID=3075376 RepID=UPI002AD401AF|nr:antirestriction protein ArdA [Nostoc sp. ChiQUE01b]MDZ8260588.1 antirestriction protein ArdA [Nostoc sp. ChiQUE01b]
MLKTKNNNKADPQIYIACLAAYNAGYLHGEWVDATQDIDIIRKEISRILETSPVADAEEYAIHDYDEFYSAESILGEYPNLEEVVKAAEFIAEHGELAGKLIAHYGDLTEALEAMEERYHGCYRSLADYAEQFTEDTSSDIPKHLQYYIDYKKMARDWEYSGDIFTIELGFEEVHVFSNH